MELNPNLYPPDGYVFKEQDGTRFRGTGWKDLEARIRGYRAVNNFPPGDPWAEIQTQTCSARPALCRAPSEPNVPPQGHHSLTFNQRVLHWFTVVVALKRVNGLGVAGDDKARERAAICSTCPAQTSLNHACESCLYTIKTARKGMLDGRDSQHQNLQPCGVLGEDCQTSVYLEQGNDHNPALPAACWRRPK